MARRRRREFERGGVVDAQALDALIVSGHASDGLVGIRELMVEMAHDGPEWGDQRTTAGGFFPEVLAYARPSLRSPDCS